MIPYFHFHTIPLGPVTMQVWGLFVSLGIAAAVLYSYRLAGKYLLSGEVMLDLAIGILLGAFVMARVFHVLFYEPQYYWMHPADVFKFWQGGASSLGGFFGAAMAIWIFKLMRGFNWKELLPYFDVITPGFWLGWGIGRLGCFMIHDHPGRLADFFLAVNFPGGARFDLGLLESILGFLLFGFSILFLKKFIRMRWGLLAGTTVAAYAVVRFCLDFLRATDLPESDARYFYLTPAQWGMLAVLAGLTFAFVWRKIKRTGEVA